MPEQETHQTSQARLRVEMPDDAIDLLLGQHRQIRRLFEVYAKEKGDGKRETALRIADVLNLHAKLEEEFFYPAMQRWGTPGIKRRVDESMREHREAEAVLLQLAGCNSGSPDFERLMQVLEDDVLHHIEEEESEMLPQARNVLHDSEEMAKKMAARMEGFKWAQNGKID